MHFGYVMAIELDFVAKERSYNPYVYLTLVGVVLITCEERAYKNDISVNYQLQKHDQQ